LFLTGTQRIDDQGHLTIGGCSCVELAQTYGTPLYVMDEEAIRARCREFRAALEGTFARSALAYAGKAFLCRAICRLVDEEGLWLDVASGGELHCALQAGFPPPRILVHGNNKSADELEMALDAGVGRIVVDNEQELETLAEIAGAGGKRAPIQIRVAPGIDPHTHEYISTGQVDTKFGVWITDGMTPPAEGAAMRTLLRAQELGSLDLRGIHCHVGSQLFDVSCIYRSAQILMELAAEFRNAAGCELDEINIGGGMGIRYTWMDRPMGVVEFVRELARVCTAEGEQLALSMPLLMVEPGRAIVGEAGTTLYTVGTTKSIPNVREYISVDGGLADNPRPQLYEAKYEAILANRANERPGCIYAVAGKHCETDILIHEAPLPKVRPGDILAVLSTGAYCHSMASNYNRLPRPACVFVRDGQAQLALRRETYEDLMLTEVG
jgi:diaminopimelate decarboxylase